MMKIYRDIFHGICMRYIMILRSRRRDIARGTPRSSRDRRYPNVGLWRPHFTNVRLRKSKAFPSVFRSLRKCAHCDWKNPWNLFILEL